MYILICVSCNIYCSVPYVDFDESMRSAEFADLISPPLFQIWFKFFKQLYEINNPDNVKVSEQLRIPKIIHQIWLGSEFPEQYKKYQESWRFYHPDWEYVLWTDAEVESFSFKNKDLFNQATNYGEKSDIWRYEILEQFGGVYVDTDFECLKPLDELHYLYDFYIGIQSLDTNMVQLGIGIIGVCQHHPLLEKAIEHLPSTQNTQQIISKTGPIFFTRIFTQYAHKYGFIDSALPASYFYPCGYTQKGMAYSLWQKPESFAVHHWAGSWLSADAFEKKGEV